MTEVDQSSDVSTSLEAIRLISDWAKWLVAIETAAITIIGAFFATSHSGTSTLARVCATAALVSFLVSIAAAAILLLSLPEITQELRADASVWMTRDSLIGDFFKLGTQGLALVESAFFGIGLILVVTTIIAVIWS